MDETVNTSVTTADLNAQASKILELRNKEAQAKVIKDNITNELVVAEGKMLELLEQADLKSYRSPVGLVSRSYRTSVRQPQTPEAWSEFVQYLEREGLAQPGIMLTVNSQKLNSFYKDRQEQANEAGKEFAMPGINEVTLTPILSFRRS